MSMVGSNVVSATEDVGDMGGSTVPGVKPTTMPGDLRRSRLVGVIVSSRPAIAELVGLFVCTRIWLSEQCERCALTV